MLLEIQVTRHVLCKSTDKLLRFYLTVDKYLDMSKWICFA